MQVGHVAMLLVLLGSARAFQIADAMHFDLKQGYVVVVPCTLPPAGQFRCVIDTGTDQSVVDTTVAKRLKLVTERSSATTFNRDQQVQTASLPEMDLGPTRAEHLTVFVAELTQSQFGTGVDVIVGLDVLRRTSLELDYRQHWLGFGAVCREAESADMVAAAGFVVVQAEVEKEPARLKVDTGWGGLLLYRDRIKATLPAASESDHVQTTLGAALGGGSVRLHELVVGGQRVSNPAALVLEHGPPNFDAYDGVIGPQALHVSQLCLDFDHHVVRWNH